MFPLRTTALAALLLVLALSASAAPARSAAAHADTATFAGGCFWSMETQFAGVPGVKSLLVGYTGGSKPHPTYEEVCSHTTGHLEALQVVFDPAITSYAKLLDRYWHSIDPTQADGQLYDIGESYRTVVFVRGTEQRRQAEASKDALARAGVLADPVVTRILPAAPFWPAEDYHQAYWKKNPQHYHAYREGSGRDRRLAQLWGAAAAKPLVH